jgi:anti-sigma factor RsiW
LNGEENKLLVCQDVSELTTDYLENALPWHKRTAMRFHLAICSFCRRHIAQVRATISLLRRLPPPPVTAAVEDRLLAQIQPPAAPPPSPS